MSKKEGVRMGGHERKGIEGRRKGEMKGGRVRNGGRHEREGGGNFTK